MALLVNSPQLSADLLCVYRHFCISAKQMISFRHVNPCCQGHYEGNSQSSVMLPRSQDGNGINAIQQKSIKITYDV